MKILTNKQYEEIKKYAIIGRKLQQYHYWFSEYNFLTGFFNYFLGRSIYEIHSMRDDFKRDLLKEYISIKDHEIILNQSILLAQHKNQFPKTETYKSMRKKLEEALSVIEQYKRLEDKDAK